jgi:DNA-binding response OmpR family regulator
MKELHSMRVLLVDDEKELVSALAERLTMRGIQADWASTPEAALEKVRTSAYDLAVLDVKMPRISGIALKKAMEEQAPGMHFIFMTGHGSEADFERGALEAGAKFYLVKPVKIETLIDKMYDIIRNERMP